jgi:hypothetical protein
VDPVVECLWVGIPLPLIKDVFFALHHLFIKRKVAIGIFAFRLVIIRSLVTTYKLFKSFLKLPRCIFTVAERKQSKAVISFEE